MAFFFFWDVSFALCGLSRFSNQKEIRKKNYPAAFRIPLRFKGKNGLIVLDQIRTIHKTRLVWHEGAVQAATLKRTLLTLQTMFSPAD